MFQELTFPKLSEISDTVLIHKGKKFFVLEFHDDDIWTIASSEKPIKQNRNSDCLHYPVTHLNISNNEIISVDKSQTHFCVIQGRKEDVIYPHSCGTYPR